jgi:hypothetical protein
LRVGPKSVPVGRLEFEPLIAAATASMPICRAASCVGSMSTRTAYLAAPNTLTCATPVTIDRRCAMTFSA